MRLHEYIVNGGGVMLWAAVDEGLIHQEASRPHWKDRRAVQLTLSNLVPPGYPRTKPAR